MNKGNIGERIKRRREQLQMSQQELADKTGYTNRASINKIESSSRGLPQKKVSQFARALQTSEVFLLGLTEDPNWKMPAETVDTEHTVVLSDTEKTLLEKYRAADDEKKHLILYLLDIGK